MSGFYITNRECESCGLRSCNGRDCYLDEPSEQPSLIELEKMRKLDEKRKAA